jgi:hypothetical protein
LRRSLSIKAVRDFLGAAFRLAALLAAAFFAVDFLCAIFVISRGAILQEAQQPNRDWTLLVGRLAAADMSPGAAKGIVDAYIIHRGA